MQLYRGMDVGTAKLAPDERRGIAHHQLDVLDVRQEAAVAAYQAAARVDIEAIRGRGHAALLVGGSGLYVRATLDQLDIPPTDAAVRAALEQQARALGPNAMYERLVGADPVAAQAISPNNVRRVVRALEVIELTGRPFSASMPQREFHQPTLVLGLRMPRDELDTRIEQRARVMFERGLLGETERLLGQGLREGVTASRAIGYAQAMAVLDGQLTTEQAAAETARATRRLARRQQSWFGPDPRICWLDAADPHLLDRALRCIDSAGESGP